MTLCLTRQPQQFAVPLEGEYLIETMGVILRFHGVSISQASLEKRLGCPAGWGRESPNGLLSAQIDITPEDDCIHWENLVLSIQTLGESVKVLVEDNVVSMVELDIGLPFYDSSMGSWIRIPAELCEVAGRNRIAVTITYYLTTTDTE